MTRDQIEALTRVSEDVGYAIATLEQCATGKGVDGDVYRTCLDRLKASHVHITEVFAGEEA